MITPPCSPLKALYDGLTKYATPESSVFLSLDHSTTGTCEGICVLQLQPGHSFAFQTPIDINYKWYCCSVTLVSARKSYDLVKAGK